MTKEERSSRIEELEQKIKQLQDEIRPLRTQIDVLKSEDVAERTGLAIGDVVISKSRQGKRFRVVAFGEFWPQGTLIKNDGNLGKGIFDLYGNLTKVEEPVTPSN